ncbi:MAG: 50S ribosomal protein L9 [Rhodospirillaceae bacterium]|nr:50S ribosomal protein L9 [Rhodospirillaceae bacterium]
MEIILLERVEKLGQMGDVVKVKTGFARNFLLPQNKALRATNANKEIFETQRVQLEAENLKQKDEATKVAGKMDGTTITLIRQAGEAGHLYGSVNSRDIATSLTDAGFTIGRNQIGLADPIKQLGFYSVRCDLHPEVSVQVNVNVARSEEEASIQAKTGKAVVGEEEVEEKAPELEAVFEEGALEEIQEEIASDDAAEAASSEEGAAEESDAPDVVAEEGEKA